MDQELFDRIQQLQFASFYRTRAGGSERVITPPRLGNPIASAYEQLTHFEDSIVEVGRLGIHEVHQLCCGLDMTVEGSEAYDMIPVWTRDGAITVRRMAGGRC